MRRFTNLVREGRFRAPAAADPPLRLGTLVEIDPSDPSRIRQADDSDGVGVGGSGDVRLNLCGILWYEHDSQTYNDPRWGREAGLHPMDLDYAPNGRMVQVLHGPGAKVWLRNTDADTTEPGLNFPSSRAAVTMVDGLGAATPTMAVGDLLGFDGSAGHWEATSNADEAFLRVTFIDHDFKRLDAEILV
jgi:hypothetical protein